MNLIERYVYEVGQNLSGKNRQDIEKEIRSLIEDSLEARTQSEGRPADDEMMVSVLKELIQTTGLIPAILMVLM